MFFSEYQNLTDDLNRNRVVFYTRRNSRSEYKTTCEVCANCLKFKVGNFLIDSSTCSRYILSY